MDEELKTLRKQALEAVVSLPWDKQTQLWNILFRFKEDGHTHEANRSAQED